MSDKEIRLPGAAPDGRLSTQLARMLMPIAWRRSAGAASHFI